MWYTVLSESHLKRDDFALVNAKRETVIELEAFIVFAGHGCKEDDLTSMVIRLNGDFHLQKGGTTYEGDAAEMDFASGDRGIIPRIFDGL